MGDLCKMHRKCGDKKEDDLELKPINEKNLNIVSQTMCKFFMAGKRTPRQIVKYMSKRPSLWAKSVANLRKSTKYKRNKIKTDNRHLKFKQMVKNKKNKKKKQ